MRSCGRSRLASEEFPSESRIELQSNDNHPSTRLSVIGGVLILRLHKVYDKEIDSMYGRWQNCLIGCSLFLSIVLVIRV
jgi:hypothetical protein